MFVRRIDSPSESQDDTGTLRMPKYEIVTGRRGFFTTAFATGLAGSVGLLTLTGVFKQEDPVPLDERLKAEVLANRRSVIRGLVESIGLTLGNMTLCDIMDKLGIAHGTQALATGYSQEQIRDRPIKEYLLVGCIVPVLEEAIFRLSAATFIPQKDEGKIRWDVGLSIASAFAAIHNIGKEGEREYTFNLTSIPLEQLVLGIYCWYAIRKAGFGQAAGAHLLYNHACLVYPDGLLLRQLGLNNKSASNNSGT